MNAQATSMTYPGFDDRWLRLLGIPLLAFIIPLAFRQADAVNLPGFIVGLLYTSVMWEGSRRILIWGTKRLPNPDEAGRRFMLVWGCAIVYATLACTTINETLICVRPEDYDGPAPSRMSGYWASYIMLATVGAIYESNYFFRLWQKTLVEKEHLAQAHLASQLEGLRNQVNPHFLFNSLNTLLYLIPESPDKAARFVHQMSKVYRYILESRDDKIIPLREELAFLDAYVFLLKERFGESLHVHLPDLAAHADRAVVPLTLQILFENAIKHNILSVGQPLHIEVLCENEHLIVRNNYQPKRQVMHSTGVGLENIRQRYRILAGREVGVIASPRYFTVTLPLIAAVAAAANP